MGPVEGLLAGGKAVPSAAVLNITLAVEDPDDSGSFAREIMNVQFLRSDLPWGEDDTELGPPMRRPTMRPLPRRRKQSKRRRRRWERRRATGVPCSASGPVGTSRWAGIAGKPWPPLSGWQGAVVTCISDPGAQRASLLSVGAAGWSACRELGRQPRGWWVDEPLIGGVMRAIQVYEVGGPEVLQVAEVDQPRPGPGEAVVEVAAAGVNFLDVYHREGRYSLPLPFTPGAEGVGTVVEVGPGVVDVAVGDRVGWAEIPGTYAERAVVDSSRLVPLPDDIDFETAAAVLLQGMTAHYLVKDAYPVQGGDTVLVHAAAGGMGLLLTQLITHLGGRVIGTTSTMAKAELAKRAGAAEVILSSAVDDLAAEVRRLNGGQGLPVVFDGVGAHTFDASLASLRPRGHLVLFGAASGAVPPFDPIRLAQGGSLTLIRPSLGDYIADRSELLRRAADVFEWVRSKALEVTVTGRYALSEAAQAHSDLEARRTTGKLLVVPDAAAVGRREETQS